MKKRTIFAIVLSVLMFIMANTVSAKGWVQVNGRWFYENGNGEYETEKIESSGSAKFYLGEDGAMATDTFVEDYDSNGYSYYFGSNGAMVTNTWVAIDPAIVSNSDEDAPSAYWYYFGANGKSYKAGNGGLVKKTIDGKKYAFNEDGRMLTGWFNESGELQNNEDDPFAAAYYYAGGENDGVLRTGWVAYYDGASDNFADVNNTGRTVDYTDKSVLWFYFNTSNCKKLGAGANGTVTKTINGKKYMFEPESGIMVSEWATNKNATTWNANTVLIASRGNVSVNVYKYYSDETDGHLVKKGWVYAVPTEDQDYEKSSEQDDEEQWFYANGAGDMIYNQIKKINGKYYIFNKNGVMQTGLVVVDSANRFVNKCDPDYTKVEDFVKKGIYFCGDATDDNRNLDAGDKLYYFVANGERKIGDVAIEFSDKDATFYSENQGSKNGWVSKKNKFYQKGILLKADADIKYGLVVESDSAFATTSEIKLSQAKASDSIIRVITTSGAKAMKNTKSGVKKDADGNYWLIRNGKYLAISTIEVKYSTSASGYAFDENGAAIHYENLKNVFLFKSDAPSSVEAYNRDKSTKEAWIPFSANGEYRDQNGRWMSETYGDGNNEWLLDIKASIDGYSDYTLNFNFIE